MSMVIRFSPSERVLRSVGDYPNGLVGFHTEIDRVEHEANMVIRVWSKLDPDTTPVGVIERGRDRPTTDDDRGTALDWDEAVAALADLQAGSYLYAIACQSAVASVDERLKAGDTQLPHEILDGIDRLLTMLRGRFEDGDAG